MRFKLFIYIVLLSLLCGCSKNTDIAFRAEGQIAVLADLKAGKTARIHLKMIYPNGSKIGEKALDKSSVVILRDSKGTEFSLKSGLDSFYWENSELVIRSGESYVLNVESAGKSISSMTSIPVYPNFEVSKYNSRSPKDFQVELENPKHQKLYFIITGEIRTYRLNGQDTIYTSNWESIGLQTQSKETDNVRFGEIYSPYKRLYVSLENSNKSVLDVSFPTQDRVDSEIYKINVKSVTEPYFDFMYSYDVFNNLDVIVDMIPPSTTKGNIQNGIGIFGGSAEMNLVFQ